MDLGFEKKWEWFVERAEGAHTKAWLAALSFTESSVFVIPPDPLLIAVVLAGGRWIYYGLFTALFGIMGAAFGYLLGAFLFDALGAPLVVLYGWEVEIAAVRELFAGGTFLVTLTAAFTPIPFKVFVLTGGFLKVNFFIFLLASAIGRSARYLAVAYATHALGHQAAVLIKRYSILFTILGAAVLFAYAAWKLVL